MAKRLNIEQLKSEYIGKTFNWLTVKDVARDDGIKFVCTCKCGNVTTVRKDKVLSGSTKSCGCYNKSKEKGAKYTEWCKNNSDKIKEQAKKYSQWCKNNPDKIKEQAEKYKQWCKDNPDKIKEKAKRYSEYCKDHPEMMISIQEKRKAALSENPEIQLSIAKNHSEWYKNNPELVKQAVERHATALSTKRASIDFSQLLEIIHDDYKEDLRLGKLKASSKIRTCCPNCGEYDYHSLHNVFSFRHQKLKSDKPRLCKMCSSNITASSYEQEISEFISTFYTEQPIKNSRDIISPLELDLYYPEKKIAIEFNGDYFHSTLFKGKNYHFDKFKACLQHGILLVSIFETKWKQQRNQIKAYIKDLFNNIENPLSFNDSRTLANNNYPAPGTSDCLFELIEDYYTARNSSIYTCGYRRI